MSGEELAGLMTQGLVSGLLQGILILAPYFIGFCILCLLIGAIKRAFRRKKTTLPKESGKNMELDGAYQPRPFFSQNEKDAYRKLKNIADKRGYIVFSKVRLLDLLEPVRNHPNYRSLFNKIQATGTATAMMAKASDLICWKPVSKAEMTAELEPPPVVSSTADAPPMTAAQTTGAATATFNSTLWTNSLIFFTLFTSLLSE